MRKNNLVKNLLAAMTLLIASSTMISCQGLIDAVIGNTDNPAAPSQPEVKPETSTATVTADQTTVTIKSLSDFENVISSEQNKELVKAIEAKAAAGEKYVINVKSEQPLSTADFDDLSLPRVENADINLVFDKPVATVEAKPLVITADEKESTTSSAAINKLTITMPDGTDNVYLAIDLPETTVKLAGNVTYLLVESVTAEKTLVVGEGVTIEKANIKAGSVEIQKGGKIKNLRVANTKDITTVTLDFNSSENLVDKLVITDGAKVLVPSDFNRERQYLVGCVEGEGDGTGILYPSDDFYTSDKSACYTFSLKGVTYLKNVTIAVPEVPVIKEKEHGLTDGLYYNMPEDVENCTFKFKSTNFNFPNGIHAKGCDFSYKDLEFNIMPNSKDLKSSSIDFSFESCKFSVFKNKIMAWLHFNLSDFEGNTVNVIFKDCGVTKDDILGVNYFHMIRFSIRDGVTLNVNVKIDDKTYMAKLDENGHVISLDE